MSATVKVYPILNSNTKCTPSFLFFSFLFLFFNTSGKLYYHCTPSFRITIVLGNLQCGLAKRMLDTQIPGADSELDTVGGVVQGVGSNVPMPKGHGKMLVELPKSHHFALWQIPWVQGCMGNRDLGNQRAFSNSSDTLPDSSDTMILLTWFPGSLTVNRNSLQCLGSKAFFPKHSKMASHFQRALDRPYSDNPETTRYNIHLECALEIPSDPEI